MSLAALRAIIFGTLRGRLILSVAVVHAVMMTVFVVDMGLRQRAAILERQEQAATAVSLSLATSAATWLATDDVAGLQELVDSQGRYPELVFAILADKHGRILAHTDESRRGQVLLDLPPGTAQAILCRTPELVDVAAPAMLGGQCVGWARIGLGQRGADRMLSALAWDGALYALAAIAIGSILAWWLGSRVTRRLQAVQGTVTAIKAGDQSARTRLAGSDEAAGLAREFNAMLDALAERDAGLRASEKDLALTLRSIGDAVIAIDAAGLIRRMNPVAEALTGWPLAEAVGRPLGEVFRLIQAESREPVEDPLGAVQRRGEAAALASQVLLLARDGQERRIADSVAPISDDHGERRGMVLVFRDVTDKYQLEERLRQSRKQEIIGQLAGGIAHDFNNMLAVIIGSAELIEPFSARQPGLARPLRMLTDAAGRAADLTAKLLGFARRGKMRTVPVDLHHEITTVVSILQRTVDRRITMVSDLAAGHARLSGDPAQIQNLLLNLCINARDAMPHGGCLSITTGDVPADAAELRALGQPAVAHVALTISDTGVGIPDWVMARLYEPFVTSKERGKGTGLGLASVHGTVRDHRGAITVDNRPGKGATFRILLPICEPAPVEAQPAPLTTAAAGLRGQTVLVADDEDLVREVLAAQLVEFGASVVQAVDGQQAVELFRAEPDRFTLVILDQVMPRLSGTEAFRAIHALRPGTRILISSGFVGEQALGAELDGLAGFLAKPYTRAELLRLALGTPSPG